MIGIIIEVNYDKSGLPLTVDPKSSNYRNTSIMVISGQFMNCMRLLFDS